MTRSTVRPLGRLLVALSLTAAAMFGSVSVATAASADDSMSTEAAAAPSAADQQAAEDARKAAEKAAKDAAEQAEKAAKDAAKEAEKAAKDAAKQEEVSYEDDRVGQLSAALHAKNAKLGGLFDRVVSVVRVKVADFLISKGRQVVFDQRGRLIVAPAVCDPAKPSWLQRNCVQPTEGGGRF